MFEYVTIKSLTYVCGWHKNDNLDYSDSLRQLNEMLENVPSKLPFLDKKQIRGG